MKRLSVSMSDNEHLKIQKKFRDWVKKELDKGTPLFRCTFSRYVVIHLGGKDGE